MQFKHARVTWIQVSVHLSQHLSSQESCEASFLCIGTQGMREGGRNLNFVVLFILHICWPVQKIITHH